MSSNQVCRQSPSIPIHCIDVPFNLGWHSDDDVGARHGRELSGDVAERVEEANDPCGPVVEEKQTVGGAQVAVGGERRELDADGGPGGQVE